MMRTLNLMLGDIRFQIKYGFYLLYAFFTLLYVAILCLLPSGWKQDAAPLIIFSDPALLGMIFTGVIVLFEKSERVINSIAVSPVKAGEYMVSKAVTLGLISLATGVTLGVTSGGIEFPFRFVSGLFLGSCIFTWTGLLVTTKIDTLNRYVIYIIPLSAVVTVPVIIYRFFNAHPLWLIHPGVATFELLNNYADYDFIAAISIAAWLPTIYVITKRQFSKMLKTLGGGKL